MEGNSFYLMDNQTKEKVFSGKLEFRKSKTNKETYQTNDTPNQNFLGADVWECDFSSFNTPGEYVLAVEGVGHSFPFKIKDDVYRHAFYNSIRGLYHNRSGIALEEPYTEYTRPAPHNPLVTPGFAGKLQYTTSRFIDWDNLDASETDLPAIEAGLKGAVNTWGWYQDAGDWDGYFTHMKIPAMLMLTWEIAPEKFADGELNIPEGENGIPDILDEASWLIRFYHRTRHELIDKGFGTGGIGSRVAPDWYGNAGDGIPSYEDTGKWIISGEDPFTTYFYAGLAGQYAAVLNKLGIADPDGIDWKKEAQEAFDWAKNNTRSSDNNPAEVHDYHLADYQLYAAVSLFRLTGNDEYVQIIEQNSSSVNSSTVLSESQEWGIYSMVIADEFTFENETLLNRLKSSVLATADQQHKSVNLRACRYGGNIYMPMLVGQGTTPQVFEIMMGHYVSKEKAPAKTNIYLSDLYTTADYFLGCNPLNMTWITHVGVRYPERVMHIDSWYNGKGEMAPGITPYGPWKDQGSAENIGPWDIHWPYKTLYPEGIEKWPGHERWFNNYTTPANAEFTIHQNTILSAVVYGYLCNIPDGSYTPNEHPAVELNIQDSVVLKENLTITATATDPNGENDIAWVEFYNDWHKIGQSNEAPYSFEWKKPKYGSTNLSAKVVDKSGYSSKSEELTIKILPSDFNISIEVKDSLTGEVLPGTIIDIEGEKQTSDENGVAVFQEVSGLFGISLTRDGYKTKTVEQIAVYNDTTLVFYINPEEFEVSFIVQDIATGEPLGSAEVVFDSVQQNTDLSGATLYNIYPGEYNFEVSKDKYMSESGTLTVSSDTTFYILLVQTEAEIKFVLKNGETPVNKATIVVNEDTLSTSGLGIARYTGDVNSIYNYSVEKDGYYVINGSLILKNDTTVNIQMVLTDVNLISNNSEVKLWPNPVNEKLYFDAGRTFKTIEIYSLKGIKMKSEVNNSGQRNSISLTKFTPGMYFLKITFSDDSSAVKKFEKK